MSERPLLEHAIRRARALAALAAVAWAPLAVLTIAVLLLGGAGAVRANVFASVVVSHAAIAIGYALAVPAMLRVLHADMSLRRALEESARALPLSGAAALTVVPVSLVAVSLWPEVWGTVAEVLAVQMLAVAPLVIVCQLAWMQHVADGGDAPAVAYDTWWLLRRCGRGIAAWVMPAYLLLFVLAGANLVPVLTAPLALSLTSVPFTVWTWRSWCAATGAHPAWAEPAAAPPADRQDAASASSAQQRLAPILLGGGGPARLELATTAGVAAGAWLQLEPRDTFTISVQVGDHASREWAVYLWRPGGQWRELEQLWNDGRVVIAHGVTWGERAYLAVARRDGAPGVRFTAWVSVATQAAPSVHAEAAA